MTDAPDRVASHFDELIGGELLSTDPDDARVRVAVRPELLQPFGIVHGGVYSSLIEGLCSVGTFAAVYDDGMGAMGQSIDVNFLRPISRGAVNVSARARHRGRTTWIWEAEVTDDDGRLCALATMTIAVRPRPKNDD